MNTVSFLSNLPYPPIKVQHKYSRIIDEGFSRYHAAGLTTVE